MEKDFTVECNVCKQRYDNWSGSTPCCGSIAYLVNEEGEVLKQASLHTTIGVVMLDLSIAFKDK